MATYVVVRAPADVIADAVSEEADADVLEAETLDTLNGNQVQIVEFDDHQTAVAWSVNREAGPNRPWNFFGTVFSDLDDARENARTRAEGQ